MQTPADLTAQLRLNFGGGALPSLAHKNMHLVVKSSTASLTRFIRQTRRSYGEQTNITLVSPVQAQPIDTKVHTLVMHFKGNLQPNQLPDAHSADGLSYLCCSPKKTDCYGLILVYLFGLYSCNCTYACPNFGLIQRMAW